MCCHVCLFVMVLFFFFKQKTAYEMRISDWSSDVCSSDLIVPGERSHRLGQFLRPRIIAKAAIPNRRVRPDKQFQRLRMDCRKSFRHMHGRRSNRWWCSRRQAFEQRLIPLGLKRTPPPCPCLLHQHMIRRGETTTHHSQSTVSQQNTTKEDRKNNDED